MSPRLVAQVLVLFLVGLASSGCATRYAFGVDAIAANDLGTYSSYHIVRDQPDYERNKLRYDEAERYVERALAGANYVEAASAEGADMLMSFDFGMDEARTELETRSEPVYYWAPSHTHVVQQSYTDASGNPAIRTIRMIEPPRREFAGYQDRTIAKTHRDKYLRVSAFQKPAEGEKPGEQLWSVVVVNSSASGDLRRYLPMMAAAAMPYMGEDTGEQIRVVLEEKDPDLAYIRSGR